MDFMPARGLANAHVQTLLPRYLTRRRITHRSEELVLPDGDFLDLAWMRRPAGDSDAPLVVVFHGLEGSVHSPYAGDILWAIEQRGWHGVLMHFRGCSGRPNRLARSYHSGETGDARYFIEQLRQWYPRAPLVAVGYSLGGNMLLKLQAEWGSASPLRAAVSVSAPLRLEVCAERINQGFSRVYQRYLLNSLIGKVLGKFDRHDYETLIGLTPSRIGQARSFREFDQYFTAPIHGFADADDYYQRASAYHRLGEIQRPALIIQALDDPFMTPQVLPPAQQLSEQITLAVSRHGGHVGFMSGTIVKPSCWLPVAVTNYLAQYV